MAQRRRQSRAPLDDLLKSEVAQSRGPVMRAPVIEPDSVLDSTAERYLKAIQRLIGADDTSAVMMGAPLEVPPGALANTGKKLVRRIARAFDDDAIHITTPANAAAIGREGFDVGKGRGIGGDDFGPGVYLSDRFGQAAGFWRDQLATRDAAGTVPTQAMKARVRLSSPLVLEDLPPHAGSYRRPSHHEQLMRAGASDLVPSYEEKIAQGLHPNKALGAVAREAGYDGLRIIRRDGDEIIAFDPATVTWKQ